MSILLVGSGGHARVSAEVLAALGWEVAGCLNRDGDPRTQLGVPVLGPDSELERRIADGCPDVFVAVGDNRSRLALGQRVLAAGGRLVTAVSPHSVVSPSAEVGRGVLVMPGAVVNAGSVVGDLAIINTNATVDHDCTLGEAVHIAPAAALAGGVRVGRLALVGVGAAVVPGIAIGESAIVGAGAAVVRDVPASTTVVGVPARTRGSNPQ